ncbi:MAG: sulfite exporter TauE/SafE family protein [Rhodobacteraceae bacterium]|nr:sulfite exporter TauE/SafE family protein [Paracoccaceae bacterium]MCF8514864.1 sulfite exporter TauE/SafE family protein [Paracoccaceae bacterium]MCF8519108.1 sulfite exporter TauE/SafE family protein [Paracoccaceae bacterium]
MDGAVFWTVAVLAAMLVGMGKGGMPGVAMLSVPVFSLVISPVTAAGLLLPVYVLSDMFGLYAYRHEFNAQVLKIMVPGMVVGVGIGWATAHMVPEWAVTMVVGIIGASFALNNLRPRRGVVAARPVRVVPGLFWGTISGFTSFVSHTGGPPYQVYTLPLKMSKTMFAGTTTISFAIVNLAKLPPYYALGQLSAQNLHVAVILMPIAAASVFLGVRFVRWVPEKLFYKAITWALLALSLKLIWNGVTG